VLRGSEPADVRVGNYLARGLRTWTAALVDRYKRVVARELVAVIADCVKHVMYHEFRAYVQGDVTSILHLDRKHASGLRKIAEILRCRILSVQLARRRREYPVLLVYDKEVQGDQERNHHDGSKSAGRPPDLRGPEHRKTGKYHEDERANRTDDERRIVGVHRLEPAFGSHASSERGQDARRSKQNNCSRGNPPAKHVLAGRLGQERLLHATRGEYRDTHRSDEAHGIRRAEVLGARHEIKRNVVERRVAAQRPEQRDDDRYGPEPELAGPPVAPDPAQAQPAEHEHHNADVIPLEVDAVGTPVVIQDSSELGEICV